MITQPAQVFVTFSEQPFGGVMVQTPTGLELLALSGGPPGPPGPPGPGSDLPATTNLLSGDGSGGATDSGVNAADVCLKQAGYPTPTNAMEIIACLQAAGLCS